MEKCVWVLDTSNKTCNILKSILNTITCHICFTFLSPIHLTFKCFEIEVYFYMQKCRWMKAHRTKPTGEKAQKRRLSKNSRVLKSIHSLSLSLWLSVLLLFTKTAFFVKCGFFVSLCTFRLFNLILWISLCIKSGFYRVAFGYFNFN